MTPIEIKLHAHLRAHRMGGVHFRPQHAIGNYIVDFCAPRRKLIIELDGPSFGRNIWSTKNMMKERSIFLKSKGYRILRFWNNDVLNNTDSVLTVIWDASKEQNKRQCK